ncbi:MAG: hypothetical protein II272_02515, partial [Oscillospiraceae bacterium]|nr:hypothetical protein [Oscillospiraceae bacterium]
MKQEIVGRTLLYKQIVSCLIVYFYLFKAENRTTASILLMNRIPPRTVCTSLSPSLREVPLPEGEARGCAEASSS